VMEGLAMPEENGIAAHGEMLPLVIEKLQK
jgi:hypothetical protein